MAQPGSGPSGRLAHALEQGKPVDGARIRLTFTMLDMDMGSVARVLPQTATGRYEHVGPRLMFGRWGLCILVRAPHGKAFSVNFVDRVDA